MGHFYFARHGQTVWNVENKICGATDIELTELGHQQAEELGKAILEQGIKIDEIIYSPLIRAKETARHVSEITGIPMREEMRLKEQNFGKYEGTPRNGEEFQKAKEANWKVSMGGILGDCSCRDGYSVRFENCTYNAERGIGNSELPDIE